MRESRSWSGSIGSTIHASPEARRRRRTAPGVAPAALALAALVSAAAPAAAQPLPDLELEVVAEGLPRVTGITHAGDERLFVALQDGRVMIVADGVVLPRPFLDLRQKVNFVGEAGLLSLVFHPDYAANGWFFVDYFDRARDTVVSRFTVSSHPDLADPSSEVEVLRFDQPFSNHNGGQLAFGPDGMLYVATGDGGGSFDPFCNGQDLSSLHGKILRLDVDGGDAAAPGPGPPRYRVPPDNPFVGKGTARGEIWLYGLRNPWRFSFDRATGDLYIGDVGQDAVEEIDLLPAGSPGGVNYGWKVMEGSDCTGRTDGCTVPLPPCPSPSLALPILSYRHGGADCAVTGGYVYRGGAIPGLEGQYLFGDFCSGRMWLGRRDGAGWTRRELPLSAPLLQTFGEGWDGEIYLGAGSRLLKLVAPGSDPEPEPEPNACTEDADTLCLGPSDRFAVEARFRVGDDPPSLAGTRPLTGDSGALWYFDPANLELLVKVIDACDPFGRFWVFASGLTDVETELTVTDTATGATSLYRSTAGTAFQPVQDTDAFATCP